MRTKEEITKRRRARAAILAGFFATGVIIGAFSGVVCEKMHTKKLIAAAAEQTAAEMIGTLETIAAPSAICRCEHAEQPKEAAEEETTEAAPQKTFIYLGEYKTTAYCACSKCCGEWADGITASGAPAVEGVTVAVDPDVIPFGTTLVIAGQEYKAQDSGSAIKGNVIDIYFKDHQEALNYGVQMHDIYIKGEIA